MTNDENFPPLPACKPRDPAAKISSMETDQTPTTSDTEMCLRMRKLHDSIVMKAMRLAHFQKILISAGAVQMDQSGYENMTKEAKDL
ncbi:hypothetical protein TNCV_3355331 [Trichonephila clavipes]|nr:hypothetical protein TNCV_3355331 [Trichonephila clavipes]